MLRYAESYIFIYLIFLLLIAPFHILHFDSYYYWDWSRHLALSYYDGSPMIAYFIKFSTYIFGDTLFALSFVSISVAFFTSILIYKIARLTLSNEASKIAALLWVLSPIVTLDLFNQTTYDAPLTLFWTLTIYFVAHYIKFEKTKDIYLAGLSIGLMMLSKYSGVVLLFGLFIFILTTKWRCLLKSYHFYAAILLAFLVFSPVIIWNYQHDWQSVLYQLHDHQVKNTHNNFVNLLGSFFLVILPILNFFLVFPVIYFLRRHRSMGDVLSLCFIISIIFIGFYLFVGLYAQVKPLWLSQFLITGAIFGGFCYQELTYRRAMIFLMLLSLLVSLIVILSNTQHFTIENPRKLRYYNWMQAINYSIPNMPEVVITSGWMEARMLFFLKNKPLIYTLPCLQAKENQYQYWTSELLTKNINRVLYVDTDPDHTNPLSTEERKICIKKYFNHCEEITVPTSFRGNDKNQIFVFICTK